MTNTIIETSVESKSSGVMVVGEREVERVVYDANGQEIERCVAYTVELANIPGGAE